MVSLSRLRGQGDQTGRSLPHLKKVIYQITLKRLSRIFDSQETSVVVVVVGVTFIYNKDSVVFLYKCTCFANLLHDTEVRCCTMCETLCSDNSKTHPCVSFVDLSSLQDTNQDRDKKKKKN